MSIYPCCECCLTDTPHPYGHETSCTKCNNPTADRLRAEVDQLVAVIDRVRELHQPCNCLMCGEYPACKMCFAMSYPCATIRALDGVA